MNTAHAIVNNMPMTTVVAPDTLEDLPALVADLRETYGRRGEVHIVISGTFPAYGAAGSPDQVFAELDMIWCNNGDQWTAWSESLASSGVIR